MRQIITFFFLSLFTSSFAQSSIWTKGNAVWHYRFWNVAENGYTKLWEAGDTTLLGQNCKKINGERHSFMMTGPNPGDPLFESTQPFLGGIVYTSNDTVYYWVNDHFNILYVFSAQVNEQWILHTGSSDFSCNDTSICMVQSVGTLSLNGYPSIELTVSETSDSYMHLIAKVNSRFGSMATYLLPFPRRCDTQGALDIDQVSFLCFEDDSLYYNPTGGACEYYLGLEESKLGNVSVFPNPSTGKIELLSDVSLNQVQVMSVLGTTLKVFHPHVTLAEIDLSELPRGTYYLTIENLNGDKVVKAIQLSGR
jgi:hypothetical protein